MQIEFAHTRDRAYARALLAATTSRSRLFTGALGVLLTLTGVLNLSAGHPWAYWGAAVALGIGICWLIKPFIVTRQVVARLPDGWFQPRYYRLTEDEVEWRAESFRTALSWDMVARVRRHRFGFVLWQGGNLAAWDIPRAGLTPEQDAELVAFLVRRRLLPAPDGGAGPGAVPAAPPAVGPPAGGAAGPVVRQPAP